MLGSVLTLLRHLHCTYGFPADKISVLLQALGVSYTEEVCLAELPAAACALMANGEVPLKAKTSAAIAVSGALQRCLRLHGLHSLKLLHHANGKLFHSLRVFNFRYFCLFCEGC